MDTVAAEKLSTGPTKGSQARPPKVLVLGDDTRSFLATVRSLGRKGIEVHVAPADMQSPALRSRYIARIHRLPLYLGDGSEWVRAVLDLVAVERFTLIIPCQDTALLPFHAHRDLFEPRVRLAIPDPRAIEVLFDKEQTRTLAARLGVNIAQNLKPEECESSAEIFRRLGAPVVVKPKNSFRLDDLSRRGVVQIVDTPAQLPEATAHLPADSYYIEEFFDGSGVGLSLLAHRGDILLAFQHHRVHEGARGGAAPYRVSAPLAPELLAACQKITTHLEYTGVAMFEFRRNFTTGRWILLEINARPWGSLPLPIALGIDFPFRWYQLLVHGERTPPRDYRKGIYGRNLGLDFLFLLSEISGSASVSARFGVVCRWLASFSHLLIGRERDDTIVADDPLPGLLELAGLLRNYGHRLAARLPITAEVEGLTEHNRVRRALQRAMKTSGRINLLFVCFGNICRSPFAEGIVANLSAEHRDRVSVTSAGTYPVSGRTSPNEAVEAADAFAVDLAQHRSRALDDRMIEDASIIFVFDEKNCAAILSRFGTPNVPVVLLGRLTRKSKRGEIADPFGRPSEEYNRTYDQITDAARSLQRSLAAVLPRAEGGRTGITKLFVDYQLDTQITFSICPIDDYANLAETWRDLETRANASFFLTWDWIGCWLEQARVPGFVVSGRRNGKVVLIGIVHPASYRRHRVINSHALLLNQTGNPELDSITIEYNGFLIDRNIGGPLQGCLEFLQHAEVTKIVGRRWDEIHMDGVPESFELEARDSGLNVWLRSRKPSWRVKLDEIRKSGTSYLDHLSANTRYQIRRSIRLYENRGPITATRAADPEEALRFHAEMQTLHQRYWISRGFSGSYAVPFYGKFHQELLMRCVASGTVEFVRVAAGSFVIGYVYNFVHDGWVCAYQTGLAYDTNPQLKPGLVAHYLCIEKHLKEGARYYDFLAGDSQYKRSLGEPGPDMLELVLQRPRAKLRIEGALREVKRAFTGTPLEA